MKIEEAKELYTRDDLITIAHWIWPVAFNVGNLDLECDVVSEIEHMVDSFVDALNTSHKKP